MNHAPERDSVEVPVFGGLEFELDEQAVSAWVARTGLNLRRRHSPRLGHALRSPAKNRIMLISLRRLF